jgi:chromosome segregation ATPase
VPPTKTEGLINTKRTFEELHIRKSNSFDRDRIELSLSSDCVDFQSENTQLKRFIDDLERRVEEMVEMNQQVKMEAAEWKNRSEESERKLQNAESQCSRASIMITEYENEIAAKEKEIQGLRNKLALAERTIQEEKTAKSVNSFEIQALKNHFQNEKDSIIQAYQHHIDSIEQRANQDLQALSAQFSAARAVGQEQIDALLHALQKKENENVFLRNTINQGLFLKASTHTSEELSLSKSKTQQEKQDKYLARFRTFSKMIDRKLFSSCD